MKQKFQALALPQSRGLMLNMSALEPLYGGQFTFIIESVDESKLS